MKLSKAIPEVLKYTHNTRLTILHFSWRVFFRTSLEEERVEQGEGSGWTARNTYLSEFYFSPNFINFLGVKGLPSIQNSLQCSKYITEKTTDVDKGKDSGKLLNSEETHMHYLYVKITEQISKIPKIREKVFKKSFKKEEFWDRAYAGTTQSISPKNKYRNKARVWIIAMLLIFSE